ncbi:hypothetical protein QKG27_gp111 [Gallid alphaherpesvirus 3]|uniref:Uncharacterized protein ORF468 n=1 Tax=Gallid alphaherpesvirus 3 TaxID=35250 RepID=F8TC86_9ALPH|nr:hypothetical protein QKG27_gp111 [Gallid alphaherpesvirus 3]AEI00296.1 hypothetical protein [Gallid alphaherpesvirus 3]QEY02330.1 hypothetical protein [Gallid alphaherpesvirus 3]
MHCFMRKIHKAEAASLDLPGSLSHSSRRVTTVIIDTPICAPNEKFLYWWSVGAGIGPCSETSV